MESVRLALDVSGCEFVTAFNRMAWAARESKPPFPYTFPLPAVRECGEAKEVLLYLMRLSQRNGWNLAQCVIDQLRADAAQA